ncbi:hypothetical protein DMC47_30675 [Nostoc sp. 3335mG]|nr:hypothetical protein DMC47_30675 [Nostoc sp. 3335mG]
MMSKSRKRVAHRAELARFKNQSKEIRPEFSWAYTARRIGQVPHEFSLYIDHPVLLRSRALRMISPPLLLVLTIAGGEAST